MITIEFALTITIFFYQLVNILILNYLISRTETFIEWDPILNTFASIGNVPKEKNIFTMNESLVIKLLFRLEA